MRILILNCYSRNSLAVIYGAAAGYTLYGGAARRTSAFLNPDNFFHHKRLSKIFRYADPVNDIDGFKSDLIHFCGENNVDLVIPTGTNVTNALSLIKKDIESRVNAKMAVEDSEMHQKVTDKWTTVELCNSCGVRTPKTRRFSFSECAQSQLVGFNFPIVIKPRISYASIGVEFFNSLEELEVYKNGLKSLDDGSIFIVQEMIAGDLFDAAACGQGGVATSIMTQERCVSLYDFGGGGIVNLTTKDSYAIELATKFLAHTKWNGPILFDFIRSKSGEVYLLECNPKIWGTTELIIRSGQNIVEQMVDIFFREQKVQGSAEYEVGLLYKWWFPELIFHLLHSPLNLRNFSRRLKNIFSRFGARRTVSNIEVAKFRHLIGIVLDRTKL